MAVADELTGAQLGDSELWIRFTPDEGSPRVSSTDRAVRPVTVVVRGGEQACLLVTDTGTQVHPEPCTAVSLPD